MQTLYLHRIANTWQSSLPSCDVIFSVCGPLCPCLLLHLRIFVTNDARLSAASVTWSTQLHRNVVLCAVVYNDS
jgi:hypothetical protein